MGDGLTFGSVCDGIGCGRLAFTRAGMTCVWHAEIEAFPSAVTEYHWPGGRNVKDMRLVRGMIESGELCDVNVFTGGTPCQAFSVAGKRKGLEDERGNLSLEFCRIADAIDAVRRRDGKPPCVVLWENVPGVLSDQGNAFGCFLGELAGSGCELQPPGGKWRDAGCVFGPGRTVAWRTLDSQYFGVAQRRKRVFVVASAGDGFRPEEVLFEREGVRRDSPPSREAGEGFTHDVAPCIGAGGRGFSRAGEPRGQDPVVAVMAHGQGGAEVATDGGAPCLTCNHEAPIVAQTYDMRGNGDGVTVGTLTGDHAGRPTDYTPVVAFQQNQLGEVRTGECCGTLNTNSNASGRNTPMVATSMQVRRLTPRECERLQGLPDDWTRIPWRGKPAEACPDGPRYKGIGNGQTVQVMEWIARRIARCLNG